MCMKKIVFFMLLWIAIGGGVVAQDLPIQSLKAKVGKQPIAIIPAKMNGSFEINPDTLNIICLGYDANFNGVFDEEDGDELPFWWKIERVIDANPYLQNPQPFNVRKVMDFDMNWDGLFPFRCRIPESTDYVPVEFGNVLPIPYKDRVVFYDMSTEKKLDDDDNFELVDSNIKSLCLFELALLTTQRVYENPGDWIPSGNIINLHIAKGDLEKIISYKSSNQNIQRVIAYAVETDTNPYLVIAVLYEGTFGSPDGSVVEFHTVKTYLDEPDELMPWEYYFDIKTINVGTNANDMVLLNPNGVPYLFVVSNGDNRIYIVDGIEQEVNGFGIGIDDNYIQVPCEAPNQLREVSFYLIKNHQYNATITSYDGNTYHINNVFDENNRKIYTIPSEGEISEASYLFNPMITIWGGGDAMTYVFFARTLTYNNDWFEPGDEVEIFYYYVTGITEINNSLKVFPNPAKNTINIELEDIAEVNSIRLINNEGKYFKELTDYSISGNSIQVSIPSLQTGNYFIELDTKQGKYIQKLIIK